MLDVARFEHRPHISAQAELNTRSTGDLLVQLLRRSLRARECWREASRLSFELGPSLLATGHHFPGARTCLHKIVQRHARQCDHRRADALHAGPADEVCPARIGRVAMHKHAHLRRWSICASAPRRQLRDSARCAAAVRPGGAKQRRGQWRHETGIGSPRPHFRRVVHARGQQPLVAIALRRVVQRLYHDAQQPVHRGDLLVGGRGRWGPHALGLHRPAKCPGRGLDRFRHDLVCDQVVPHQGAGLVHRAPHRLRGRNFRRLGPRRFWNDMLGRVVRCHILVLVLPRCWLVQHRVFEAAGYLEH
mmetsp:Transcript_22106/g.63322  ORF Transcript_22106/g.63322 Transcript_22106/m.63322 type:complete len:304 (-) Transcript_22106:534-1445(-)